MGGVSEARPWWHLWVVCCLLEVSTVACGVPPEESSDSGSPAEETRVVAEHEAGHATEEADLRLISASERGDVRAVERLLEQGAGVDARDESGRTALIAAAYGNRLDVAGLLVDAGADVNAKDETQQSAYLISTSEVGDDPRLLELTLRNGANVNSLDSYNGTGLIRASERGYGRVVERLLRTDIEVNHVNNLGWTALLEAIILGDGGRSHTEVVRLLVGAGANVNLADGEGVTPLEHARRRGYVKIVRILEAAGAR
jgi:ankyrin repeat protein